MLQIAAHVDEVPPAELYSICAAAREIMSGEHAVGRVIARPFRGEPGAFERTDGRKDLALPPPGALLHGRAAGRRACRCTPSARSARCSTASASTSSTRAPTNAAALAATAELIDALDGGFVFTNLVETDQVYGHRGDVPGYHGALQAIDAEVGELARAAGPGARPADHHRRPRLRPDDPRHRPHARARAAARALRGPRRPPPRRSVRGRRRVGATAG